MPQYIVANYLPDNFDPSTVTEEMIEEIHALNRARAPSHAMRRARCASFFSSRLRRKQRNSLARRDFGNMGRGAV